MNVERDEESRRLRRRQWLGLALLAPFVGAAIWSAVIVHSARNPEIRAARLELRHESRNATAEGPLVPIGTIWETEIFEPLAQLAPGEAAVTEVRMTRFTPWAINDSGLKVETGELEAGWVVDEFECTEQVGVQPHNPRQRKLGFIPEEWTADEVEIICTLWTRTDQTR